MDSDDTLFCANFVMDWYPVELHAIEMFDELSDK